MSVEYKTLKTKERLLQRSQALQKARQFFLKKGCIETDCLMLGTSAAIDLHIDLFSIDSLIHGKRFLFSSPEYPMKRLLSEGSGDIFYLGHVFRHEEAGRCHSPEFTMAEWYRIGFSFENMIEETVEFISDTLSSFQDISKWHIVKTSYKEIFEKICKINPLKITLDELKQVTQTLLSERQIIAHFSFDTESKDDLLHLLMSQVIEPSLIQKKTIFVITHYPSSQSALARNIQKDGDVVSERFEIYVEGIEIANGYHELVDYQEQMARFLKDNNERREAGKEEYPLDTRFLYALEQIGLPNCSGVAVGFDRLLMVTWNTYSIEHVMPLPWNVV